MAIKSISFTFDKGNSEFHIVNDHSHRCDHVLDGTCSVQGNVVCGAGEP